MAISPRLVTGGLRSIVCAVDFSLPSYAALKQAVLVAKTGGRQLTVVCVEDPLTSSGAAASGYDVSLVRQSTLRQLKRLVARTATAAGLKRDQWSVDVLLGRPARAIVVFARKTSADLIVIGTNGRRGPAKWLFGSVAEGILRRAPTPVLVVASRHAPDVTGHKGPVIGAVNFGADDITDARRIARAARSFGGRLSLVHVVRPSDRSPAEAASLVQYRGQLAAARSRLRSIAKTVGASACVALGRPEIEIVAAAAEMKARLIVLVLRRGRGIFGARQGTTTYRVLCSSRTPVLALPPG